MKLLKPTNMPEMKHCSVCNINIQKRSYNKHLTSKKHQKNVFDAEFEIARAAKADRSASFWDDINELKANHDADMEANRIHRKAMQAKHDADREANRIIMEAIDAEREAHRIRMEAIDAELEALRIRLKAIDAKDEAAREAYRKNIGRWYNGMVNRSTITDMNLLSLKTGYTQTELKKAYKKAALRSHPDKGGSEHDFRAVSEAYERLQQL